ncbi:MAG: hypothetical protein CALGDGBN_01410 [Pseudomonadales bacterium]|nr:hypothetical protein [Pseudomonadales bacterium]
MTPRPELPVRASSAWDAAAITEFLARSHTPMRLAANAANGFPQLASVWFEYAGGSLWCAMHEGSAMVPLLAHDPRCAFEIATNDPPYHGVRGQAQVALLREGASPLLTRLISRYLGDSNPRLAAWLLGRADQEFVVRLDPVWITAWDYAARMNPRTPAAADVP